MQRSPPAGLALLLEPFRRHHRNRCRADDGALEVHQLHSICTIGTTPVGYIYLGVAYPVETDSGAEVVAM